MSTIFTDGFQQCHDTDVEPSRTAAAELSCRSCGSRLAATAKFCSECGTPLTPRAQTAEYKQVTVLFADVVRSMDIAASLGAERLREIMTELLDCSTAVVQRYGGTVDKFTGDGIMALFGAPTALEDHAFRACLAAMDIQKEAQRLAVDVERRDGITLELRVGLNSGQVIAGEIGSAAARYTAVGEQVGMAQRMESAAPPGGVMLSESTARLVDTAVLLGDPEMVRIKGSDVPVTARRLLAIGENQSRRRGESALIGRAWELNTIAGILDEAIGGAGCVVNIRGPAGIGKSRLVREAVAIATGRGVPVYATYCESHTHDIAFHVLARLLRAALEINGLQPGIARARVRDRFAEGDPGDLLLLEDLLSIRDMAVAVPDIAADARRRRLTALVNAASLEQRDPAVYVIEDVHWIDEVSESMLAQFLAVIPQTRALVLTTYRPEYRGELAQVPDAQTMALRPLNDAQASALATELLGDDPSVSRVAERVAERAAGNPFFAEEMVRDLAERGVLQGVPGAYLLSGDVEDATVPATLQATIGARVDRLEPAAKRTLNAAAVIGLRFDTELLGGLVDDADVTPLIEAQLIDPVRFTPMAEYAFRHPMIRTVAYESQLKSDRAQLHRRLAAAIESGAAAEENATLIAEHLEAAGDLHAAFAWHMRAGTWSTFRDIASALTSWRRAIQVADRLPDDDPDRLSMRIESRSLLCASAFRVGGSSAETGFDELRALCAVAGDQRSLALGMAGLMIMHNLNARNRDASRLADELIRLLESIGDATLTVAVLTYAMIVKHETAEMAEILRLADHLIDLAGGDLTKGHLITDSPLSVATAMRGVARGWMGRPGWQEDIRRAIGTGRSFDAITSTGVVWFGYITPVANGLLLPETAALRDTAEALAIAERSGDNLALDLARTVRAVVLIHQGGPEREAGLRLLTLAREKMLSGGFSMVLLPIAEVCIARYKAQLGDFDGAIEGSRTAVEEIIRSDTATWIAPTIAALVESLLSRGSQADLHEARAAIHRLANLPTHPEYVIHEIWLLRLETLLAKAIGDEAAYASHRDRYRARAAELGFEGHIAWASEMA
ncbi:ATP-binding protein [Mycobacterium sp.]|uniref:ATP-binding protein n=1 Tax=Mycobacterium sp. TaxID=1785 RepID=UPI003C724DE5